MPPPYTYDYPRPAVTVDLAAFALVESELRVLLVRRGREPFLGSWALPGGFLEIDESPEVGARRELREETRLALDAPIHPIGFYADPGRDPRGRTISLAYAAAVRTSKGVVAAGDDAAEAAWRPVRDGSNLAFDHDRILRDALGWLSSEVRQGDLGLSLLPEEFDPADVAMLYRAVFGSPRGSSHWLRRMESADSIEPREGSGRLFHARRGGIRP